MGLVKNMRGKKALTILVVGLVLPGLGLLGCIQPEEPTPSKPGQKPKPGEPRRHEPSPGEVKRIETGVVDLSGLETARPVLTKHYRLSLLRVELRAPQYGLPLNLGEVANFESFSSKIPLSGGATNLLRENGFVVIPNPFNPHEENITKPYQVLKEVEVPIFVTTDSLLHLYHIQFVETLRRVEEQEFYEKLWVLSEKLLGDALERYEASSGDVREAARRNIAFFSVGLELLEPSEDQVCEAVHGFGCGDSYFTKEEFERYQHETPRVVGREVREELRLIEEHKGFAPSPIFRYREDYSQYVPRGHYTRSEKLKNYFRCMMWYGRIAFLLKGGCPGCFVSEEDARIQTIGASMIATSFAKDKEVKELWDRIYTITSFYVGFSDDLGPYEYLEALNKVFGDKISFEELAKKENIARLKAKLAEYRSPKIYGGTGDCVILPPFTPEQADKCLENSKGLRLMGQRFVPDSYIFQNLVGTPRVGRYTGNKKPFTLVVTAAGPTRGFPRGLDVMALLGSKRAKELLVQLGDSDYEKYWEAYEKLEEEFEGFDEADWNKNLYWAWLFALKPLLKEYGEGYPTFMCTKAWQDKALTTALASWAELRHDTILYAKPSYTAVETAVPMPPPEKPVVGYVEPVPEFYNRLLALTRMTRKGLDELQVLDDMARYRLGKLEEILERLVRISEKELGNQELSEEDYEFIKNFGDAVNAVIADVDEKAKKTTIIADVHTDNNTQQVLEEGLGYVDLIVVAYKLPDGRILLGAGPVMSYYEFKQPIQNRLTDEEWTKMLAEGKQPEKPEWTKNYAVTS